MSIEINIALINKARELMLQNSDTVPLLPSEQYQKDIELGKKLRKDRGLPDVR